jgi:hypothetical protein
VAASGLLGSLSMIDRYTKAVLTVIALALVGLLAVQLTPHAEAQMAACGTAGNACYVTNYGGLPISVKVAP